MPGITLARSGVTSEVITTLAPMTVYLRSRRRSLITVNSPSSDTTVKSGGTKTVLSYSLRMGGTISKRRIRCWGRRDIVNTFSGRNTSTEPVWVGRCGSASRSWLAKTRDSPSGVEKSSGGEDMFRELNDPRDRGGNTRNTLGQDETGRLKGSTRRR